MLYAVGRRSGGGRVCLIRFNAFEERGRWGESAREIGKIEERKREGFASTETTAAPRPPSHPVFVLSFNASSCGTDCVFLLGDTEGFRHPLHPFFLPPRTDSTIV